MVTLDYIYLIHYMNMLITGVFYQKIDSWYNLVKQSVFFYEVGTINNL